MKKSIILYLFAVAFAAAFLPGCSGSGKIDLKAETAKIQVLEEQMLQAFQQKDVEKLNGYHSPDVVVMAPGKPICKGAAEDRKSLESQFADTTVDWEHFSFKNETIEVAASGDLAIVRVTDFVSVKTPAGLNVLPGKGLDVWKKVNGEWKLIMDIWNSDQ